MPVLIWCTFQSARWQSLSHEGAKNRLKWTRRAKQLFSPSRRHTASERISWAHARGALLFHLTGPPRCGQLLIMIADYCGAVSRAIWPRLWGELLSRPVLCPHTNTHHGIGLAHRHSRTLLESERERARVRSNYLSPLARVNFLLQVPAL